MSREGRRTMEKVRENTVHDKKDLILLTDDGAVHVAAQKNIVDIFVRG